MKIPLFLLALTLAGCAPLQAVKDAQTSFHARNPTPVSVVCR